MKRFKITAIAAINAVSRSLDEWLKCSNFLVWQNRSSSLSTGRSQKSLLALDIQTNVSGRDIVKLHIILLAIERISHRVT